jgi:hypothetical protein
MWSTWTQLRLRQLTRFRFAALSSVIDQVFVMVAQAQVKSQENKFTSLFSFWIDLFGNFILTKKPTTISIKIDKLVYISKISLIVEYRFTTRKAIFRGKPTPRGKFKY